MTAGPRGEGSGGACRQYGFGWDVMGGWVGRAGRRAPKWGACLGCYAARSSVAEVAADGSKQQYSNTAIQLSPPLPSPRATHPEGVHIVPRALDLESDPAEGNAVQLQRRRGVGGVPARQGSGGAGQAKRVASGRRQAGLTLGCHLTSRRLPATRQFAAPHHPSSHLSAVAGTHPNSMNAKLRSGVHWQETIGALPAT